MDARGISAAAFIDFRRGSLLGLRQASVVCSEPETSRIWHMDTLGTRIGVAEINSAVPPGPRAWQVTFGSVTRFR